MPKHARKEVEILDTTQKKIYLGRRQPSLEERLQRQIRGQYRDIQETEAWEKSEELTHEATDFTVEEKSDFGEGSEIAPVEERMSKAQEKRNAKLDAENKKKAADLQRAEDDKKKVPEGDPEAIKPANKG